MTHTRLLVASVVVLVAMGLAGCGTAAQGAAGADPAGGGADAAAGMCAQEDPGCIDTPELADDAPVAIDETGVEQLRRDAQFYLGAQEDELTRLVRVGRVGDEHMALTEDYRIGRITVELDDLDGDGTPVVTSATVELPDGPETFGLER